MNRPAVIEPGKMIVRVSAAGIRVVGMTMWQNGVLPSSRSSSVTDPEVDS